MNKQAVVHSANKVLFRALKKGAINPQKTWRDLQSILLCERANVQKATYYMIQITQHSGKNFGDQKKDL